MSLMATSIAGPSRLVARTSQCCGCIAARSYATKPAVSKKNKANLQLSGISIDEAALKLKESRPKNESWAAFELEIHTRPNPSQNMNALRGRIFPPHQILGKESKDVVAVFAQGKDADLAREAGADLVGGQDLATQIAEGQVNPDKIIAHPSMMSLVNPLARLLGPKGLMPSTRRGTVTEDLGNAIRDARGGLDWKADEKGVVRSCIGRLHMPPAELAKNVTLLVDTVADLAAGSAGQSASAIAAASFTADAGAQSPEKKKRGDFFLRNFRKSHS